MAKTVSRNHIARLLRMATVEAAQDVMADFMLRKADSSTREGRATDVGIAMIRMHRSGRWRTTTGSRAGQRDQP